MTDKQTGINSAINQVQTNEVDVLWQVADIVKSVFALELEPIRQNRILKTKSLTQPREGVNGIVIRLDDESIIHLRVELLAAPSGSYPSLKTVWSRLAKLADGVHPLPPTNNSNTNMTSYWLEMKIQASASLSITRRAVITSTLETLDTFATEIQAELPMKRKQEDLEKVYADCNEVLIPVSPHSPDSKGKPDWLLETNSLLDGSINIALASSYPICQKYALSALADIIVSSGNSLGLVKPPTITTRNLLDITHQAPGRVAVSCGKISLGSSPYEIGNQMQYLLSDLSTENRPVIFYGTYEQLQGIFHGGQGGINDPLVPVVINIPQPSLRELISFALQSATQTRSGLSEKKLYSLSERIEKLLNDYPTDQQIRMLPAFASFTTTYPDSNESDCKEFLCNLSDKRETLAGYCPQPRANRHTQVQTELTNRLLRPDLIDKFTSELFAQETALTELVNRLQAECLTRGSHQPLRYCAQGTPGTGKSASAAILAKILEVPHINIDASSIPDYYTASAQLLGSGRGIVGSYEAGRLEKAAKHSSGAVIEVSDLDHAPDSVRGHLADLFLQVLDTGEAQSATGSMFSCANLIFAFTINLPAGRDELLRRGMGFETNRSLADIQRDVESEIKTLFSSAFLSRIGKPILFAPLNGSELALIAEKELKRSLVQGLAVLGSHTESIDIVSGTGDALITRHLDNIDRHGARVVAELTRQLITNLLLTELDNYRQKTFTKLTIGSSATGDLKITLS